MHTKHENMLIESQTHSAFTQNLRNQLYSKKHTAVAVYFSFCTLQSTLLPADLERLRDILRDLNNSLEILLWFSLKIIWTLRSAFNGLSKTIINQRRAFFEISYYQLSVPIRAFLKLPIIVIALVQKGLSCPSLTIIHGAGENLGLFVAGGTSMILLPVIMGEHLNSFCCSRFSLRGELTRDPRTIQSCDKLQLCAHNNFIKHKSQPGPDERFDGPGATRLSED